MKKLYLVVLILFNYNFQEMVLSQSLRDTHDDISYIEKSKSAIIGRDFNTAKLYIDKAIGLSKSKDESLFAICLILKSNILLHQDSLYEAESLIDSTLQYLKLSDLEIEEKNYASYSAYHLQGLIFKAKHDYENAEIALLKCHRRIEYEKYPRVALDLSEIYFDQDYYRASFELARFANRNATNPYLKLKSNLVAELCSVKMDSSNQTRKTLQINHSLSKFQLAQCYKLIGDIHQSLYSLDSALVYHKASLNNASFVNDEKLEFKALKELVNDFNFSFLQSNSLNLLDSISKYANNALHLDGNNQLFDLIYLRGILVKIDIEKKDSIALKKDVSPFLNEETISKLNDTEKAHAHDVLSFYYESIGDVSKALAYSKSVISLKDKIQSEDRQKLSLVQNYNISSYPMTPKNNNKKESSGWLNSFLKKYNFLIFPLTFITVILVYITYQKRKKRKIEIEQEKESMEKRMQKIIDENNDLIDTKENPVHQVKGSLDLPGNRVISYDEIIKITTTKQKGNIQIHTFDSDEFIIVKSSITKYENQLPKPLFMKTSPGSIVNILNIREKSIGRKRLILADDSEVKVTDTYRKSLFEAIEKNRIGKN